MAKRKPAKPKPAKTDGLSGDDLKRIHKAVRQVWSWSYPWRLAKARAMGDDGFPRCENRKCPQKGEPVPKVFVDHIDPVGEVGGPNYIARMFIPSRRLQALCKKCHDLKTREERREARELEKQDAAEARAVSEPERSRAHRLQGKRGDRTPRQADPKTCPHDELDAEDDYCLLCGKVMTDFY